MTTIFGPASFVIGGVLHIAQTEQVVSTLNHLGYPAYFALILGVWKVLGAIAIVVPRFPRLKEWAYAGFVFDLTAAARSRAAVGDSAADILAPLGFLALVLASWRSVRRAERSLRRLFGGSFPFGGGGCVQPLPVSVPLFPPTPELSTNVAKSGLDRTHFIHVRPHRHLERIRRQHLRKRRGVKEFQTRGFRETSRAPAPGTDWGGCKRTPPCMPLGHQSSGGQRRRA